MLAFRVLLALIASNPAALAAQHIARVVTVVLIIGPITVKNRLVKLDIDTCDFLGKQSYGIYVIHPLIIFFSAKLLRGLDMPPILKYGFVYCFVLAATIFVSWFSYTYIEKWFLTLKLRYTVVESSNARTA